MLLSRKTQGIVLILASTLLLINNLDNGSVIGGLASVGFIVANAMGLYIHIRR